MSADDHKQALPPGFRLGPYRVVRVLGAGGFGVTYLCEHAGLGVQVAVKEYLPNEIAVRDGTEVHPKSAGDREGFEWGLSRFLDEARTLARFEHRNVVRVRDCFEANNTAYIVMDYEEGELLDALLRRHGTLTEAQLKRVVLPVVDGLRQVHAAGFLHRDIKPSNIYVRRSDESPVLLDFGSARQALGHRSRSLTAIASAGYSPPEQYEGTAPQGAWTDIYALSALCYRAVTGNTPMGAPWRQSELLRTRTDPLPRLVERQIASYSPAFLEAVDWGLRLVETERPQSLDKWLPRLDRAAMPAVATSELRQAAQTASPSTVRRTGPWIVGGAILLVGLVWWAATDAGPTEARHVEAAEETNQGAATVVQNDEGGGVASGGRAERHRQAAEQGDAEAQFSLGFLYEGGVGVPKDVAQAAIWYRKAAEQGLAIAQVRLGQLYYVGDVGVPKDAAQAAIWFRKAAEQGEADVLTLSMLGRLYAQGEGVPKDAGQAAVWLRMAAEQGFAEAQNDLGILYARGEGVPRDSGQAAVWYRKAAEQGHAHAQRNLGVLYARGEGVPKNAGQAAIWVRKAAEQGLAEAQTQLGLMYAEGDGVPKDANQAAIWYRKAAEQGYAWAQFQLSGLYARGNVIPKDMGQAVAWARKAAEQGLAEAQLVLGLMYAYGDGVPKDAGQAAVWYRKAAEQGLARAQDNLGVLYFRGDGVPLDLVQSYAWLNLAAAGGVESARDLRATVQGLMTRTQIADAQRLSRELAD